MNVGVYLIINLQNGKIYVGSSQDLIRRFYLHDYHFRRGTHHNEHLQRAWDCYGPGSFDKAIVEYCGVQDLTERENWWMALLGTRNPQKGYNRCAADHTEVSAETRAKISLALKGRTYSPESRARMAAGQTGRIHDAQTCAKKAASRKGKPHSPDTRAKLAARKVGKPATCSFVGRTHSAEARAKIAAASASRSHSPETKLKMSAAASRRTRGPQGQFAGSE